MKFSHLRYFSELTNEHRNEEVQLNFPLIRADLSAYLHLFAYHTLNSTVRFASMLAPGWNVKYYSKGF